MRVAFITRSTLFSVAGGDSIHIEQTAKALRELGTEVDILLTNSKINYGNYNVFHFFNLNRPADILSHVDKIGNPFFLSPILIDYSEYDKNHRKGFTGWILRRFSADTNEYIKSVSRWLMGRDSLQSKKFLWLGQKRSIRKLVENCTALLVNSEMELIALEKKYDISKQASVIPNGIDASLFYPDPAISRDNKLVLCVARIEGIKNQLNLIRALNDTEYTLLLIGSPAPNQKAYAEECRRIAGSNIIFKSKMPQQELLQYYNKAKVHVLPSWFETCGLSSLEAAAMGCNLVITDKGYAKEYFRGDAFYCDPSDPVSIRKAVESASSSGPNDSFQSLVSHQYTWKNAARLTLEAYKKFSS
jgi:glycosyltransferase involved in cell wall biosynthesis